MRENNMTPDIINATFGIAFLAVWAFIGGVVMRSPLG